MNDKSQPLVSIIIPLFNQERYFDACMKSVCNQTYRNLEIIVVNDGSTDCGPRQAEEWADRDSRVKVIHKTNEGVTMARRDGYLQAEGDFVAFLDSDDLLPIQAIETMVGFIVEKNVDLVIGSTTKKLGFLEKHHIDAGYSFPYDTIISLPELFDKYYVGFFSNKIFPISMWGRLYRKSCIDKAFQETELFPSDIQYMGEDHFFNLKLFPYITSMYRTGKDVYTYRYGGGTAHFNSHFPSLFWFSDLRMKLLDNYHYYEGYEPLYEEYISCLYYHAAQSLHFKQADKEGIIGLFKEEHAKRTLMPRLKRFYTEKGTTKQEVQCIVNEDYEGMYQCACQLREDLFCSIHYKLKQSLLWLLNHIQ